MNYSLTLPSLYETFSLLRATNQVHIVSTDSQSIVGTMVEPLSVAASAAGLVSLAVQLGETVIKLKTLCQKLSSARKELNGIVFEIETFSLLLRGVDEHLMRSQTIQASLLERAVVLCQEGVDTVGEVAQSLEAAFRKSKAFGSMQVVLKERKMKALVSDLERGKATLLIAWQIYTE